MSYSAERQWRLLGLIPSPPRDISITQLKTKYTNQYLDEVSYKKIERDLKSLAKLFPQLQFVKRGATHCWYIDRKDLLEFPKMDSATALAFYLVEQQLKDMLPPDSIHLLSGYFLKAKKILDNQPSDYSHWRKKIKVLPQNQKLIPPKIDSQVLSNIYIAVLEERRFKAKYFGRRDDQYKEFNVNPLSLVIRGTITYLVCTLDDYKDIRLMNLNRFVEVNLSSVDVSKPLDYDLESYLEESHLDFLVGEDINLEMLIDEEVAIHLRESKLSDEQTISYQNNRKILFQSKVKNTGQLRWWLLGFAEQIEILSPASLREEFIEKIEAMSKRYMPK